MSSARGHAAPDNSRHLRLSSPPLEAGTLGRMLPDGGEVVSGVASRSLTVSLARGAAWTNGVSSGSALLAVDHGFVAVSSEIRNGHQAPGRRIVLATAQGGTLLVPPAADERVEAVTDCRFTVISHQSLRQLVGVPGPAEAIANALARELAERSTAMRTCAYVRHVDRVREKLLQLARRYGRVVPGGVRIEFPLTHQLLADMVGSARETVSLAIVELAREGLVRRHGRVYLVRIPTDELLLEADGERVAAVR